MEKQLRFETMKSVRPPVPTIRTPDVAERIARRIIAEVNLDDFYWEPGEIEDRVYDVTQEIARCGRPANVFSRLYQRQPPFNDRGDRGGHPFGWEGIDEHCRHIADEIAEEELDAARKHYTERYR
jgi:hypothetical protein